MAQKMGPGNTIVTLLPDAGYRHWSSFWKFSDESSFPTDSNILSFIS